MSYSLAGAAVFILSTLVILYSFRGWLERTSSTVDAVLLGITGIGGVVLSTGMGSIGPVSERFSNIAHAVGVVLMLLSLSLFVRRKSAANIQRKV